MSPGEVGVQVRHPAAFENVFALGYRSRRWCRLECGGREEAANLCVCLVAVDAVTEGCLSQRGRVVPPIYPRGDAVGEHEELNGVVWLCAVECQAVALRAPNPVIEVLLDALGLTDPADLRCDADGVVGPPLTLASSGDLELGDTRLWLIWESL